MRSAINSVANRFVVLHPNAELRLEIIATDTECSS